jgi:L-asparaginase
MEPKILLIYTGGTIGMIKDAETGALKSFNFAELLVHVPEIKLLGCQVDTFSFDKPIDSSNMNLKYWSMLADVLNENYDGYTGFVVLHGSDTMSHTGSTLSFLFSGLKKPIILTGSQLPIGDLRTDAKENLITSLQLATQNDGIEPLIQEVCIYFEYQLYRANRTAKMNAEHFEAFSSPNYPPLAISGVHLNIKEPLLWRGLEDLAYAKAVSHNVHSAHDDGMTFIKELDDRIVILKLFPGITKEVISSIRKIKNLKGIILETYGSGNAPNESWFVDELKAAIEDGLKIVNVTQCRGGSVDMGKYETSVLLEKIGVVSGKDVTTEAAVAKMMFLLKNLKSATDFKTYFETSLKGELSN